MKLSIGDFIKIGLFIVAMSILIAIEFKFQKNYQDNRKQQKIEHEFYIKNK